MRLIVLFFWVSLRKITFFENFLKNCKAGIFYTFTKHYALDVVMEALGRFNSSLRSSVHDRAFNSKN